MLETYKNGNVYYVDSYLKENSRVNIYSLTLESAKRIADKKAAFEICIDINNNSFKIFNICPQSHKEYSESPTISRRDNKNYICSYCGTKESLYGFINKGI